MGTGQVTDTFVAEPAKLMPGTEPSPGRTSNYADGAGPSATVADALTLPSKLFDAIRNVCHARHPLSGALSNTPLGWQLNVAGCG